MSRKSVLPQSRRHIWVFDEDWEFLESNFGSLAHPTRRIGCGAACRQIIHSRVKALRQLQVQYIDLESSKRVEPSPFPIIAQEPSND